MPLHAPKKDSVQSNKIKFLFKADHFFYFLGRKGAAEGGRKKRFMVSIQAKLHSIQERRKSEDKKVCAKYQ